MSTQIVVIGAGDEHTDSYHGRQEMAWQVQRTWPKCEKTKSKVEL